MCFTNHFLPKMLWWVSSQFCLQNISSCVYEETKKFRGFDFGWDSGNLLKCFRFVKRKVFIVKKITAQCQCNIILEGLSNDKFCNSVFLLIYRICCWTVSIDVEYSNTVQYPYGTKIFSNMQHEMQFSVSNVWEMLRTLYNCQAAFLSWAKSQHGRVAVLSTRFVIYPYL